MPIRAASVGSRNRFRLISLVAPFRWSSTNVQVQSTHAMEQYVRHVPQEEEGHLVGIVSARDLLGAYAVQAS